MDETSTAERLNPPFPSGTARPGFLLIIVMVIGAALGLLLLNAYQQNIRTRFQSQAFLQNQLFFLELNRTVQHVIHHFRQKSLDQILENSFPPEAPYLPRDLNHWSVENRLEGKYLHNTLRSSKRPNSASFNLLLILEKQDLTERPWTLFSSSMTDPPEPVQVEAESQALLDWQNRPFWLPQSEDSPNFGKTLEGIKSVEISGALMQAFYDNGSQQSILIEGGNQFIRILENPPDPLFLKIDLETLSSPSVYLEVEGPVRMEAHEGPGFPQNTPLLMIKVFGNLSFTRNSPNLDQGQAGGHFLILGNPCFELEQGLSEVFFSGSLSCSHPPTPGGLLKLKHQSGPGNVPPPFQADFLRFGGVLIREE